MGSCTVFLERDTYVGRVAASRASLSRLLVLPVDESLRWCCFAPDLVAAAATVGEAGSGTGIGAVLATIDNESGLACELLHHQVLRGLLQVSLQHVPKPDGL
jgi:hypothetical protein